MGAESGGEIKKEIQKEKEKTWGLLEGHKFLAEVTDSFDGKTISRIFSVPRDVQEVFVEGSFYKYKGETRSKGRIIAVLNKDGSFENSLDFGDQFFGRGTEVKFDPSQKNLQGKSIDIAPKIPK